MGESRFSLGPPRSTALWSAPKFFMRQYPNLSSQFSGAAGISLKAGVLGGRSDRPWGEPSVFLSPTSRLLLSSSAGRKGEASGVLVGGGAARAGAHDAAFQRRAHRGVLGEMGKSLRPMTVLPWFPTPGVLHSYELRSSAPGEREGKWRDMTNLESRLASGVVRRTFPDGLERRPAFNVLGLSLDLTLQVPQAAVSSVSEVSTERLPTVPHTAEVPRRSMTAEGHEITARQLSVPEVAERVYRLLERRLVIERERRGIF